MASVDQEDRAQELEAALSRLMMWEKLECSILLNHIRELKEKKIELNSKQIYAVKEADAVQEGIKSDDTPIAVQERNISTEILELNCTKLNHVLARDILQKTAFSVQIQDAVHETLQGTDVEADVKSSPALQDLLEHHSSNFHTSKTLLGVIEEKEQLDKDILKSRMDYQALLKNIKEKWDRINGKAIAVQEEEDPSLVQQRTMIETREAKVKVIIHMLQGLISASGIKWGGEEYYVKVMLLCDAVLNDGDDAEIEELLDAIEDSRDDKGQKDTPGRNTSKGPRITKYFTSTPIRQ